MGDGLYLHHLFQEVLFIIGFSDRLLPAKVPELRAQADKMEESWLQQLMKK